MRKRFTTISACIFAVFTIALIVLFFIPQETETPDEEEPSPTPTATTTPTPSPTSTPTPTPTPGPTPTPIPKAYEITDTLTITLSNEKSAAAMHDRDYTTKCVISDGVAIEITADEEIHSLYIIWDKHPGMWQVESDITEEFGKEGYLHEFVPLSSPAVQLTLTLPEGGTGICDIYAFTEGYVPDWVQTWQSPHEKADILLFPTHADDEHLFFVGIMPYYAGELGYKVQVAYMIKHSSPRPHELLNGLWTVGIKNYPVIGEFNDRYCGSMQEAREIYGFDNFVNYQVTQLRRFKPSVVVGHDLNGEYGHGAHMLNAYALTAAVIDAADKDYHEESYKEYGIWDTPKLYLHLYKENEITMDWDIPLVNFGGATAREMATAGYDCHISQHIWSFRVPQTPEGRSGHVFGLYRSTVGEDILGGDLMENIR